MLLHESNLLPQLYLPRDNVRDDLLTRTAHRTHCPFKGDASYWSVTVGDRRADNALWSYLDPLPDAGWLSDHVALYWTPGSTRTRRLPGTCVIPTPGLTPGPAAASYGWWPAVRWSPSPGARCCCPRRACPTASTCRSMMCAANSLNCPEHTPSARTRKGTASYRSVRTPSGVIADAAWCYQQPLEEVWAIRGYLCVVAEGIDTWVNGVLQ